MRAYRSYAAVCSLRSRMLRLVYTLLIYVAVPVALGANLWRGIRDRAYWERLGERLGFTRLRVDNSIWVHAVSVGEVQAAAALIRELAKRYSEHPLIVTTGTPTGAARVKALYGTSARHVYLPYDTPGSVSRFIDRIRPRIGIVMETEVWPNLFRACDKRQIPLVIASARLSQKSVKGYRWLASLFKNVLASGIHIAAQTRADADRFIDVGANPHNTRVVGNIKFDLQVSDEARSRGQALRSAQFPDREVWIAGSTHAKEEDVVLDAHARLRERHPRALLILVPRHPQRFDEVRANLIARGVAFVARSSQASVERATSVLLVDSLGELMMFYAAADIAFVGGSFVPIGGHNLLEPAALSLPIITGPHNFNAPDVANTLLEKRARIEVRTCEELAAQLTQLFGSEATRSQMGEVAHAFVEQNRGALSALLTLIDERLH